MVSFTRIFMLCALLAAFARFANADDAVMPDVGGVSVFSGTATIVSSKVQKLLEAGIDPKADVTWSFGTNDPSAVDKLEEVLLETCSTCAQIPTRPPRCRRSLDGWEGTFLSYGTTADSLQGFLEEFSVSASNEKLGAVAFVIDGINPKREIEPRPRPCR